MAVLVMYSFLICFSFLINCVIMGSSETEIIRKPISENCLQCICKATGCNKEYFCKENICGMFYMTKLFWIDAGKPTIEFEDDTAQNAYENCANDETCARQAVVNYMDSYYSDCNGDNVINCTDYAHIHNKGRHGCRSPLTTVFGPRFVECEKNMPREE